MKINAFGMVIGLVAIAALVVGIMALNQAQDARALALSEINIEEINSLSTPILSEETNAYSFLMVYDISIANMSGPGVTLKSVKKATRGAGFLTLLKGQDVISAEMNEKAFVSEKSSSEIKSNPRLLNTIGQTDIQDGTNLNLMIAPGETKMLHLGISLNPYNEQRELLAHMALVSFELEFDNGKSYIFQRGFPIYPIQ